MTRCLLRSKTRSRAGAMSRSGVVKPGTSALVESTRNRSTPASPSRANARRSVSRPSSGSWSILKSPVCRMRAGLGADRHRERVRDRVVDGDELEVERPHLRLLAVGDDELDGVAQAVLLELLAQQRQREPGADERDVRALLEQVGHGADVVLVPVGEDQADHVVQPVGDRPEAGQDQVDAGVVVLGEEDAAVHDQQLAVVLDDGHVAADVPEPAERGDAHRGPGQGRGGVQTGTSHVARPYRCRAEPHLCGTAVATPPVEGG